MTLSFTHFLLSLVLVYSVGASAAEAAMPKDISAFIARRDQCDHFRGEAGGDESPDEARAKEIREALDKFCKNTDRDLKSLRRKYAHNPAVLKRLAGYESDVE